MREEGEHPAVASWILIGYLFFISPRGDNIYEFDLSALLQRNKGACQKVICNESFFFSPLQAAGGHFARFIEELSVLHLKVKLNPVTGVRSGSKIHQDTCER